MKRLIIALLALLTVGGFFTAPVQTRAAQNPTIKLGDEFTGTFSPEQLQLSYSLQAKKDTYLLFEFRLDKSSVPRPPIFRVRVGDADVLNTTEIPGEISEGMIYTPKDGEYILDVLPPPGEDRSTFVARVLAPVGAIENAKAITAQYAAEPFWYVLSSNGQTTLSYSSPDANGLRPLTVSGIMASGLKVDGKDVTSGYLKPILSTDNTVGGDPDFGAVNSVTLIFNPKPAQALYWVRVGGGKRPLAPTFTLLRTDAKK
jgi:hypothetical protein